MDLSDNCVSLDRGIKPEVGTGGDAVTELFLATSGQPASFRGNRWEKVW